jgi:hypothetical protein
MKRTLHVVPPSKPGGLDRSPHLPRDLQLTHRDTSALRYKPNGEPVPNHRRGLFMATLHSYHGWSLPEGGMPGWLGWLIGLAVIGCFALGAGMWG